MNKIKSSHLIIIICGIVLVLAVAYYAADYFAVFKTQPQTLENSVSQVSNDEAPIVPSSYQLEEVAANLFVPWSIVFTSSERLLVTERSGAVRIIEDGKLKPEPLHTFTETRINGGGEEGLMGMALDPNYSSNKLVYVCLAYMDEGKLWDKVVSFKDNGNNASELKTVLAKIPAAQYHAGCRLLFLADNKLYISTGDSTNRALAQDMNSLAGKILRLNSDGSIPEDNPFTNSAIWSLGHRNPQGLAWDSERGLLWSSEHGPSLFDGPAGGDEINIIEKGKNYGWPTIDHDEKKAGLETPVIQFTPAVAPGSLLFYNSDTLPFFKNNLFFGGLAGEGLFRIVIDPKDPKVKPKYEKLKDINVGRIREVSQSPDGFIYFTTSNRDGRGDLRANDDKIYRLIPKK